MYAHVMMQVRINGQLGDPFASEVGVKQGDPLSPLLFGLFIDRIEAFIRARCPGVGVEMAGMILQVLLYADDLVLMATSPQDLQKLLDCLSAFCHASGMTVNVRKSEVVVFNMKFCTKAHHAAAAGMCYEGKPLTLSEYFMYLGMIFAGDKSIAHALGKNITKAKQVTYAMIKKAYAMGANNVHTLCHLFDSLVVPVLNYGCELWGPYALARKTVAEGLGGEVELWHRSVLRQMLGVRSTVATPILMSELGRQPISMSWLTQTLRFWNKICARPNNDLVKIALNESVDLAVRHRVRNCWAAKLNSALCHVGSARITELQAVNVVDVVSNASRSWQAKMWSTLPGMGGDVRCMPDNCRSGFRLHVYKRWFAQDKLAPVQSFTYHLFDREQIRVVAQFRMGVHWLNTVCMPRTIPRSARTCTCCSQGTTGDTSHAREDEMHIFECPLYSHLREKYGCTLAPLSSHHPAHTDADMSALMNGGNDHMFWENLANFLIACKGKRALSMA